MRQEVNTARMAHCCFYRVQTKASWLHVFPAAAHKIASPVPGPPGATQASSSQEEHALPETSKKNKNVFQLACITHDTCTKSPITTLSLPIAANPRWEKTQMLQQTHRTVNILTKNPQAHSSETNGDIARLHADKRLRNSNTLSGKGCSRIAPPCSGRLRHCCPCSVRPEGFFQRSCGASHMRLSTTLAALHFCSVCCSLPRSL